MQKTHGKLDVFFISFQYSCWVLQFGSIANLWSLSRFPTTQTLPTVVDGDPVGQSPEVATAIHSAQKKFCWSLLVLCANDLHSGAAGAESTRNQKPWNHSRPRASSGRNVFFFFSLRESLIASKFTRHCWTPQRSHFTYFLFTFSIDF